MGIASLEGIAVIRASRLLWTMLALPALASSTLPAPATDEPNDIPALVLVIGAAGEPEYATNFVQQAAAWTRAAAQAGAPLTVIGIGGDTGIPDRDRLQAAVAAAGTESRPLWLVLIGHGTWDERDARFNLRGPDVSAAELASWLMPVERPVAVINTASASAPFLKALAGTNRVVITATRSGAEVNATRFGLPFAEALTDPAADLDHDGQVSLLEAFIAASSRVAEWYATAGRLATEHALLEDSGDGLGTPADWFRGVRAVKQAREGASTDGGWARTLVLVRSPGEQALGAEVRMQRDALERELEALRERKASLEPAAHAQALESVLLRLARLYEEAEPADPPPGSQAAAPAGPGTD
ncbi:MAG: hypothetical protein KF791_05400 [Verrucomicrobiae bacterium]|nr:hypothetical protein [Verrucomicrobiae bacterium]